MASLLYSPAACYDDHPFTNHTGGFISEEEELIMAPYCYGMVSFSHPLIPSSGYLPQRGGGFMFQHQLLPTAPQMDYVTFCEEEVEYYMPDDVRLVSFHEKDFLVTVAKTPDHVDQWIRDVLDNHGHCLHRLVLGLDTEWRPNLDRGDDHPIAIIQLSVGRSCLIFQFLHAPWIPESLQWLLENPSFTFCGVGIDDDANKLYQHHGLRVGKTLDLHALFRACYKGEYWRLSLKDMCWRVLRKEMKKPKQVTLSAWDNEYLDDDQVEYAAIDAFVSLKIGLALLEETT